MAIRWWTEEVKFADGAIYTPYYNNSLTTQQMSNVFYNTSPTGRIAFNTNRYSGPAINTYFNLGWLVRNKGENVIGRRYDHYLFGSSEFTVRNVPHDNDSTYKTSEFGLYDYWTTSYIDWGRSSYQYNPIIGFLIDDVNHEARAVLYWESYNHPYGIYAYIENMYIQPDANIRKRLYNALVGAVPVYNHYRSVANLWSVNGNTNLSMVLDTVADNGETKTITRGDITNLPDSANFGYTYKNMAIGEKRLIAWCGDNRCYLFKNDPQGLNVVKYTLSFSLGGQPEFYSFTDSIAYDPQTLSKIDSWLGFIKDDATHKAKPAIIRMVETSVTTYYLVTTDISGDTNLGKMYTWLTNSGDTPTKPNPFIDNPRNEPGGGTNYHPRYDEKNIPQNLHSEDGLNLGYMRLYELSRASMISFSQVLWSDGFLSGIKKLVQNPIDVVLSIKIFPVTPEVDSPAIDVYAGNYNTGVLGNKVTNRYQVIDCGEMDITGAWDCYLDYSPLTKMCIYLPFCGEHDLNVDDLMQTINSDNKIESGGKLKLRYIFDFLTGACVAQLMINGSVHYQFPGHCACDIPVTSENFNRGISTLVSTIANTLVTVATHGMSAPLTAATIGTSLAANVANSKPDIIRSGNLTAEYGFMSYNAPYLTIEEPVQASVDEQREFTGLPNYYTGVLSDCNGFTKVGYVHIEGFTCTDEERDEIERLLKEGVIIDNSI